MSERQSAAQVKPPSARLPSRQFVFHQQLHKSLNLKLKKSFSDDDPSDGPGPSLTRPRSGIIKNKMLIGSLGKVPLKTRRGKAMQNNGLPSEARFADEVLEYNYRRFKIKMVAHSKQFFKQLPRYNLVKYRVNKMIPRSSSFNNKRHARNNTWKLKARSQQLLSSKLLRRGSPVSQAGPGYANDTPPVASTKRQLRSSLQSVVLQQPIAELKSKWRKISLKLMDQKVY